MRLCHSGCSPPSVDGVMIRPTVRGLLQQTAALKGRRRKVGWNSKIHFPYGLIPTLGGESMMFQCLGIPKVTFERAAGADRGRTCNAARELHRLDGATHRMGHCKH